MPFDEKAYMRTYRLAHKDKAKEYRERRGREAVRAYVNRAEYRSRQVVREQARKDAKSYRLRYPEKAKAQQTLRHALERGEVMRPNHCEACGCINPRRIDGRSKLHGHHHKGYELPLEIIWLCAVCHNAQHRAKKLPT